VKHLASDSQDGPFLASVSGDSLTLEGLCQLVKSSFVDFELILEGSLGGLSARDTFTIHVECVGAIGDEKLPEVSLYPNPGDGEFILDFSTGEPLDVSVYTLTGVEVYARRAFLPGAMIDLSAQPAGAYMVRIKSNSGVIGKMIQKL
jgi:hypothetical protein